MNKLELNRVEPARVVIVGVSPEILARLGTEYGLSDYFVCDDKQEIPIFCGGVGHPVEAADASRFMTLETLFGRLEKS